DGRRTLKDYVAVPGVYAAGRLDTDSEGLLLLTDDGGLQHRIADPRHKLPKTYLVQVEGEPDDAALARLRAGVDLGDFHTRPCDARRV
ncbi:MAG TPA: pseudouridine synthase, partial [Thauera sp.]|nr:pseudouridine synthase [Thauera sp.]